MGSSGGALVIAPHVDDEVLGCFAWLNHRAHVLHGGVEDRPSTEVRLAELEASAGALGFSHSQLGQPVNRYAVVPLIAGIEAAIDAHRPATVLIPEPSYNQDHRAMYDAAIAATRPHDANHRVDQVLVYEQPSSMIWRHGAIEAPNVFVPIDIDAKIEAYQRYRSQVRAHRSPEVIRAIATLRGSQIGVPAAEAFHARRIVLEDVT